VQKLDPILQPILGEDKDNLLELLLCGSGLLRHRPELLLQAVSIRHVIIQIRPYHQGCLTSHGQTIAQFPGHLSDQFAPATTIPSPHDVAALPRSNPGRIERL
jgi:hypothetical protein